MENKNVAKQSGVWTYKQGDHSFHLYYEEEGIGDRHVVLLHGFAVHSYVWRYTLSALANAGYHVWALDFLGHGKSDKPLDVIYDGDFLTLQVEHFIRSKNLKQPVVVGNSLGGGVAALVALKMESEIRALILIDALVEEFTPSFSIRLAIFLGSWLTPFVGKTTARKILNEVYFDKKKISEELVSIYAMPYESEEEVAVFIKMLQSFDNLQLKKIAKNSLKIHVPTLIIWGKNDPWMPDEYYQRVIANFPNAAKVLIPHCGHVPQEECPEETNRAILDFLSKLPR